MTVSISDMKPFVGARDYSLSREFYAALGWQINFDTGDLAELQWDEQRFFLQNYYQRAWCDNTMLHVSCDDAKAWHLRAEAVLASGRWGDAKVREPTEQDYGALVTFVWDPSGVLWHFAQCSRP